MGGVVLEALAIAEDVDARLLDNPMTAGAELDRAANDDSSAQVLRWALASATMELNDALEVRVVGAEEERGRAALLVGVEEGAVANCAPADSCACRPLDTLDGWHCIPSLVIAGCTCTPPLIVAGCA